MKKKLNEEQGEWSGMHKNMYVYANRGFPFLGFVLLVVGVIWLLESLKIISIDVPWWPVILILLGLWFIAQRFFR